MGSGAKRFGDQLAAAVILAVLIVGGLALVDRAQRTRLLDKMTPELAAQLPHQSLGDLITPAIYNAMIDAINANTSAISTLGTTANLIAYFPATSCPSGWAEYTAARGLYVVGRVAGGTVASAVGTALSDLENRATGQHTHTITDPGHHHAIEYHGNAGSLIQPGSVSDASSVMLDTDDAFTGISINATGAVVGTNAPYIELIVCKHN